MIFVFFSKPWRGPERLVREQESVWPYPGIVELGLHADHVPLLLELRPQDLEFVRLERPVQSSNVSIRAAGAGRAEVEGRGLCAYVSASIASVRARL